MAASEPRAMLCVAGIAFDGARVLLVRRGQPPGQGLWTVPGGRVEPGETLRDACARELREETGLVVAVGDLVEVVERIHHDDAGCLRRHYVILDYLVAVRGGQLAAGDDADDARWFDESELESLPVTDGLRAVVRRARALQALAFSGGRE
jgi:ADP-ribose pyrophosphatase YjhB (NUDIX family)